MKKVPLYIGRHNKNCHVVGLNNRLVYGTLPNTATPVLELNIAMEEIAQAFSLQELEEMVEYRKTH